MLTIKREIYEDIAHLIAAVAELARTDIYFDHADTFGPGLPFFAKARPLRPASAHDLILPTLIPR